MTIGICGAAGQLGRLTVEALKPRMDPGAIVALVRDPSKVADLGVAAREADYAKPETLVSALTGLETLLLISSNAVGVRVAQHRNVITAAKAAGVARIVYTSLLHADVSPLNLADDHRLTEADLRSSGLAVTILRNGWYTENYTGSIPSALANGAFFGSAGEGRISSAPRLDYAEAAAAALVGHGHEGKTYELAGDQSYTLAELAAELSRQSGLEIPYRDMPEAEYVAKLTELGLPAGFAAALAGWDVAASHGALYEDRHDLSALIGRPTTPLSTAVALALH